MARGISQSLRLHRLLALAALTHKQPPHRGSGFSALQQDDGAEPLPRFSL
jgi:hypothetical protein